MLQAGPHRLRVHRSGHRTEPEVVEVEVPAAGVTEATCRLIPLAEIRIEAFGRDEAPLPGQILHVRVNGGPWRDAFRISPGVFRLWVDPGSLTLQARSHPSVSDPISLEAEVGKPRSVEIRF